MQNLWLALTVFSTTALTEVLYFLFQKAPIEIPIKNVIGLFIVLGFMSFIKQKYARIFLMNLVIILSWFQMLHIQYYSLPVYPNAIFLLFTQHSEIVGTLLENGQIFLLPSFLFFLALYLNLYADKKLSRRKQWSFFHWPFILYLLYNPMRTYFTGNTWGRQPSSQEFMGVNVYLSISYFVGKILPFKVLNKKHQLSSYPHVQFTSQKSFDGNIILVMGESLTPNHMSLFHYERATTTELEKFKSNSNFFYTEGLSSAVSSDVSIASFFNNTYGLNAVTDIGLGKNCLFRLAKKSNFQTHFYSTQSTQQLRYITNSICPKQIDHFKSLEDIQPDIENPNLADDHLLINLLPESDQNQQQHFYVLHQRGTHSPYKLRYGPHPRNFSLSNDYTQDRVNHYDNGVINFDLFMQKLLAKVQRYKRPTVIIYVSDHGESLGEEGVWGHANLGLSSLKIPILIYSHQTQSVDYQQFKDKDLTHFNISLLISELLGYKSQYKMTTPPKEYKALGNDLDGFAGYLDISFKDGRVHKMIRKDL